MEQEEDEDYDHGDAFDPFDDDAEHADGSMPDERKRTATVSVDSKRQYADDARMRRRDRQPSDHRKRPPLDADPVARKPRRRSSHGRRQQRSTPSVARAPASLKPAPGSGDSTASVADSHATDYKRRARRVQAEPPTAIDCSTAVARGRSKTLEGMISDTSLAMLQDIDCDDAEYFLDTCKGHLRKMFVDLLATDPAPNSQEESERKKPAVSRKRPPVVDLTEDEPAHRKRKRPGTDSQVVRDDEDTPQTEAAPAIPLDGSSIACRVYRDADLSCVLDGEGFSSVAFIVEEPTSLFFASNTNNALDNLGPLSLDRWKFISCLHVVLIGESDFYAAKRLDTTHYMVRCEDLAEALSVAPDHMRMRVYGHNGLMSNRFVYVRRNVREVALDLFRDRGAR